MTGMSADDRHTDKNGNEYEEGSLENELKAVERVFGTTANPTAGKYYLVKSADVSNIVENDIFKQVMQKVQNPIHTVKVVDYFPQDILDNFEITIVNPSIGSVLNEIKKETKTIEWDIGTLKGNEIATLQYKLKIKNMSTDSPIYNKEIATNEKIVLTYKDMNEKDYSVTLSSSPKIKLLGVEKTVGVNKENDITHGMTQSKEQDITVANKILPNTGRNIVIIGILLVTVILVAIGIIKNYKYREVK